MPELRQARQLLLKAQREVIAKTKAAHAAELALGLVRSSRGMAASAKAAKLKAALTKAAGLLKSANDFEVQASRKLAKVIASEAAKASAEVRARVLALYQKKLELKTEADLQKAIAGFTAAWKRRRAKLNARKLARVARKASAQAVKAERKANAKARAAVEKAADLSKARTRRIAEKAKVKAARLKLRVVRQVPAGVSRRK